MCLLFSTWTEQCNSYKIYLILRSFLLFFSQIVGEIKSVHIIVSSIRSTRLRIFHLSCIDLDIWYLCPFYSQMRLVQQHKPENHLNWHANSYMPKLLILSCLRWNALQHNPQQMHHQLQIVWNVQHVSFCWRNVHNKQNFGKKQSSFFTYGSAIFGNLYSLMNFIQSYNLPLPCSIANQELPNSTMTSLIGLSRICPEADDLAKFCPAMSQWTWKEEWANC